MMSTNEGRTVSRRVQAAWSSPESAVAWCAWLHSPTTGWFATLVTLAPAWTCAIDCSCTLSIKQRALVFGLACLAGAIMGYFEVAVLQVVPHIGTVCLMLAASLALPDCFAKNLQCRWRAIRAGFLPSWVVSYFISSWLM